MYQSPDLPGVCTKPTDTSRHSGFWLPEAFARATHSLFALVTASSMAPFDSAPSIDFTPAACIAAFTFSRVGAPKESLYTQLICPSPPAAPSPVPVPVPDPPPPSAANAPATGVHRVAAATIAARAALPHFLFLLVEPNVPSPFRDFCLQIHPPPMRAGDGTAWDASHVPVLPRGRTGARPSFKTTMVRTGKRCTMSTSFPRDEMSKRQESPVRVDGAMRKETEETNHPIGQKPPEAQEEFVVC